MTNEMLDHKLRFLKVEVDTMQKDYSKLLTQVYLLQLTAVYEIDKDELKRIVQLINSTDDENVYLGNTLVNELAKKLFSTGEIK